MSKNALNVERRWYEDKDRSKRKIIVGNELDAFVNGLQNQILGSFPEESRHCAFLAADTLQDALNDYMIKGTR